MLGSEFFVETVASREEDSYVFKFPEDAVML